MVYYGEGVTMHPIIEKTFTMEQVIDIATALDEIHIIWHDTPMSDQRKDVYLKTFAEDRYMHYGRMMKAFAVIRRTHTGRLPTPGDIMKEFNAVSIHSLSAAERA